MLFRIILGTSLHENSTPELFLKIDVKPVVNLKQSKTRIDYDKLP